MPPLDVRMAVSPFREAARFWCPVINIAPSSLPIVVLYIEKSTQSPCAPTGAPSISLPRARTQSSMISRSG